MFRLLYVLFSQTYVWLFYSTIVSVIVVAYRDEVIPWVSRMVPSTSFLNIIGNTLSFLVVTQISVFRQMHTERLKLCFGMQLQILRFAQTCLINENRKPLNFLKQLLLVVFEEDFGETFPKIMNGLVVLRPIDEKLVLIRKACEAFQALTEDLEMFVKNMQALDRQVPVTQYSSVKDLTLVYQGILMSSYFTGVIVIDLSRNMWHTVWTSALFVSSFVGLLAVTRSQTTTGGSNEIRNIIRQTERLLDELQIANSPSHFTLRRQFGDASSKTIHIEI